ncbi:MAG TPA: ribonuclease D [Nocardioides sp.]|uniref:ribonuclease D n=1 Tax=Nocardioides sp. TaxID=35761 RepID=UPI002E36B18B|nr:ribonuclease D [Nocardioides sp.]HEX5089228.1 ribonuclease D [Nocardioides sp.]
MPDPTPSHQLEDSGAEAAEEPRPLLILRDGLPPVTDTAPGLEAACAAIDAGTGPVAIDAERASGYRYSSRAYLIQLRREGSGTWLVDPVAFDSLAPLAEVLAGTDWILHAASQDLPCLAEVGLRPDSLFDTELAGRLLGYPRVGLATLVETVVGRRMKKEHSAVDWSRRPLPEPWLEYAALDVEVLVELRAVLEQQLVESGKDEWARQEFDNLLTFELTPRVDAWRRTSGMHRIRGRRGLAAVKALWEARDQLAERRDVTPGRIIPDSAIVAAAQAMPGDRDALLSVKGFHGRGAERYAARWVAVLREVAALDESELPTRAPRTEGPPLPRAWAERDPVAARRLVLAREALAALSVQHEVPAENLLTPDYLRRVLWTPPATRDPDALAAAVATALTDLGARRWQIELTGSAVTQAILAADQEPSAESTGADRAPDEQG